MMRGVLSAFLLLSLSAVAGYVLVTLIRAQRTRTKLRAAQRLAQASVLRYGGVIQPRRRVVESEFGVFVRASCPEEAATIVSISDAFKPVGLQS